MRRQLFIFLLVLMAMLVYTALKGILMWPTHPYLAIDIAVVLFVIMLGATFLYRYNIGVFEKPWFRAFAWIGSLAMGLWAGFILLSLPFDLVVNLIWAVYPASNTEASGLIMQDLSIGVLLASTGIMCVGLVGALRGPRVREVVIPMEDLDPALRNLKIVQISDLHVGLTIRKRYVEEVVRRVNALQPDLIFATGDLVDAKVDSLTEHLQPLANLNAKAGVFYVTGNHEYYWGVESLIAKIRALGLQPLLNENRIVRVDGADILIGGVTDPMGAKFLSGHTPDAEKAMRSDSKSQLKILLAHRPDTCVEAERLGFDLQFSGHTHGGQFFPFNLFVRFAHKFHRGLNRQGRLWVYVNPGTGFWGPANRFAVASEISLIKFQSGPDSLSK